MIARRPFLRTFTLAACGLFVPQIVRAVPPPLLDRTLRRKVSNDALNVGLVGAWTLAAGNGLTDWSGHGNNGTGQGTGFALGGAANHLGQAGRATSLVLASTQYIQTTNASVFQFEKTSPFTIHAWVKSNDTVNNQIIVAKQQNSVNYAGLLCYINNSGTGQIFGSLQSDLSHFSYIIGTNNARDGAWHSVDFVSSGTGQAAGLSIYLNAKKEAVSSSVDTVGASILNAVPLNIGARDGGGAPFNGSISDVRIYNRALPPSQIQSLMLAKLLEDPAFAREFWAQNPDHFLRPVWEERMAA